MRSAIRMFLAVGSLAWLAGGSAVAQDVAAITSGDWNVVNTWNTGVAPVASNNVYIGSNAPGTATATVVISANDESAKNVYLGYGTNTKGTLDLDGHKLTIGDSLQLGTAASGQTTGGVGIINETNGGSFQALTVDVRSGNSLTFGSNDVTGYLVLGGGSSATTTATGNVTTSVVLAGNSTLNMGADLKITGPNLTGTLTDDSGSVVKMNGHSITADVLVLGGPNNLAAGTVDRGNGGTLNLVGLASYNGSFDLAAGDKLQVLESLGGTITTAATSNVTDGLAVTSGGTIKLGADLLLNQTNSGLNANQLVSVQDSGSILDAQGHSITADSFLVGKNGTSAVSVRNLGLVTVNTLEVGNGTTLTLHGGDTIGTSLGLTGGSTLDVQQVNGMGLTFDGKSASDLSITSSHLDLTFTSASGGWDFRWQDPTGSNWISTLQTMIDGGEIALSLQPGESYQIVDSGGYTYIDGVMTASVPEPSSLVLGLLAAGGIAGACTWRRRRGR